MFLNGAELGLAGAGRTSQNGLIAAVAARSILSGATLHAHDPVVLGVERLFGQRLVTLCTTETLFMPGASFVAQLLEEERRFLQKHKALNRPQRMPHTQNRREHTFVSTEMGRRHSAQDLAQNLVWQRTQTGFPSTRTYLFPARSSRQ